MSDSNTAHVNNIIDTTPVLANNNIIPDGTTFTRKSDGTDIVYSSDMVIKYFSEQVYYKILDLPADEQGQAFQMMTDYCDIICKIFDMGPGGHTSGNHPIFDHIRGQDWVTAKRMMIEKDPNADGSHIDFTKPKALFDAYDNWKANKSKQ
jgi:hypothetical protein